VWAGAERSDELWKYSVATETWEQIVTAGDKPSARRGHAMAAVDNVLWMHGGEIGWDHPTSILSDELWKYSTTNATWQRLTFAGGTKPTANKGCKPTANKGCNFEEARLGHAMAVAGGDLIIIGGVCSFEGGWNYFSSWTQDIWKYSTATATWEKLFGTSSDGDSCGLPAEAFTAELAVAAVGADIFVLGGVYINQFLSELSDKLWKFSPATATLVEVLTSQPEGNTLVKPPQKYGCETGTCSSCQENGKEKLGCGLKDHAMVAVGDVLWMYGGSAVHLWEGG
jgi:N-acetylneuraminic acid mutarotase